jgi:drug/metabolite transporter (DMT)-like permease
MLGAFAAMIFVGASWGANVPITKVMLAHFDLIPMSAIRTASASIVLAVLLLLVEGRRALRIDLGFRRFAMLGLMMGGFFAFYTLGIQFSNPITAATVAVAGPLASSTLVSSGPVTFGGGEIVLLLSNSLWTLYSLKAQAWFDRASQLHRTYVASLSAMGWMILLSVGLITVGWTRSPLAVTDAWAWAQLLTVAVLASGFGGYFWNVGASRLGVAVASLWVNLVPFFAVLWSMAYGFVPNAYQIVGGLVALSGVVYMQWRRLQMATR